MAIKHIGYTDKNEYLCRDTGRRNYFITLAMNYN